jgi:transcriptional regulator with XRE-family HTH domain
VTESHDGSGLDELRGYLIHQRVEMGLSQTRVAELMRTSQSNVSELEKGQVRNPGVETLARWARAVGVELELVVTIKVRRALSLAPTSVEDDA